MKSSSRIHIMAGIALALSVSSQIKPIAAGVVENEKPRIQMAILLDNSGSMRGLINQARNELWRVVNEFIGASQNGVQPELEVALFEYGNGVKQISHLTTDLDKISENLFGLGIRGGTEKCGEVIQAAVTSLEWTDSKDALKVIFIAGNEPFTQGSVNYREACKAAIAKGINVNTIHCGDESTGINTKWKDGALLADGNFLNINHNHVAKHIEAPQDKKIAELGVKLNTTYIPFGKSGSAGWSRQNEQDKNAANVSAVNAQQRAVTKASAYYKNTWCLADQYKEGKVDLAKVAEKDLPENMKKMKPAERKSYVESKLKERETIQIEIKTLNQARSEYISGKRKELAKTGDKTLDSAMIETIQIQAAKKQFKFK